MASLQCKYSIGSIVYAVKNCNIHKLKISIILLDGKSEPIYNNWILESNAYSSESLARKAILKKVINHIKLIDHENK